MIATNAGFTSAATLIGGQFLQGLALQLGAGIAATFGRPLGAGPLAQPVLPSQWGVTLGTLGAPQPAASWTASTGAGGRGNIDLGDGYKLELNENNSEITVLNQNTGERTRIWGDPHVEVDGKHAFDFWGTTSFTLANGTKLTINTEQWGGNPNAYVASQVVITKGNQAIVVDGISQNKLGDLSITMGQNGRMLDAVTRDGFTLHENAAGAGWLTETGKAATQADLDVTRVGAAYGPGSNAPSLAEAGDIIGSFLSFGVMLGFLGGFAAGASSGAPARAAEARQLPFSLVA